MRYCLCWGFFLSHKNSSEFRLHCKPLQFFTCAQWIFTLQHLKLKDPGQVGVLCFFPASSQARDCARSLPPARVWTSTAGANQDVPCNWNFVPGHDWVLAVLELSFPCSFRLTFSPTASWRVLKLHGTSSCLTGIQAQEGLNLRGGSTSDCYARFHAWEV